jgi:hypothetical protein
MPYSGTYANALTATILRADGPITGLPVSQVISAVEARLGAAPMAQDARGSEVVADLPTGV